MQPYDFLMIAILVGLTLYGYTKGMAWQVAHIASLIASYFVALNFADQFAPMFGQNAPLNKFIAMLVIYIATSFGIWMLFRVVRGAIDSVKMEGFDHQMGALIGLARGVLWCVGVTFFAVTLLPQAQKEMIIGSQSGRYIAMLLDKTESVVPPEVHEVIGPVIERIEQKLQPGAQSTTQPTGQPTSQQPTWPNPNAGAQSAQPQTQPASGGWPSRGQAAAWPNANPSSPSSASNTSASWPQPGGAPGGASGTPAQPAGWPNPNP